MNDTEERSQLEQLVRDELRREAIQLFPDDMAFPPAPDKQRQERASWWLPLLAAVFVAALSLVSILVFRVHHGSGSNAPATTHTPTPSAYPEASEVSGVRVLPLSLPAHGPGMIAFSSHFPAAFTVEIGQPYRFTFEVSDSVTPLSSAPSLLTIQTNGVALQGCPSPFLVRSGHTYAISCTITVEKPASDYMVTVATLAGVKEISSKTPIVASSHKPERPRYAGGCTSSQLVLGTPQNDVGGGTYYTSADYVTQPFRNTGAPCVLEVPKTLDAANATSSFQSVATSSANTSRAITFRIPSGENTLVIGAWWSRSITATSPITSTATCRNPVGAVSRIEIPLAVGDLSIALPTAWPEVCATPASTSIEFNNN